MSPTRRKRVKAAVHPNVKQLASAGLAKAARLTDALRKKVAKLTKTEVKALVSAKKKLKFKGTLHGKGADFF